MILWRLNTGHTVVAIDIDSCAGSINQDRLRRWFLQTPADRAAVDQLHKIWPSQKLADAIETKQVAEQEALAATYKATAKK
jgi:hypothetical protein